MRVGLAEVDHAIVSRPPLQARRVPHEVEPRAPRTVGCGRLFVRRARLAGAGLVGSRFGLDRRWLGLGASVRDREHEREDRHADRADRKRRVDRGRPAA